MRRPPPPSDDLSEGPVRLDAGQPSLQVPTESADPVTVWVRVPRNAFGAKRPHDYGRLENILGVPRPWIGDPRVDPVTGLALSRAGRVRHPRRLPPVQELPIQVRGLTVTGTDLRPLLQDVSFDIAPGEVVAIGGPAPEEIDALVAALTGQVDFAGRISYGSMHLTAATASAVRSSVAVLPPDDSLGGPLPLHRALAHYAALRQPYAPREVRRAAVAEVLESLGLIAQRSTPMEELTAAERRRAAIAMAVLARASVMVLRDPTDGLDPDDAAELLRLVQALALGGRRTVLFTTHSPLAFSIADRIVLLDRNPSGAARLGFHGPPADVATHFGSGLDWDFAHVYAALDDPEADWSGAFRPHLATFDPDAPARPGAAPTWPPLLPAAGRLAFARLEEFWWRGERLLAIFAPTAVLVVLGLALLGWGNLDSDPPTAEATSPRLLLGFVTLTAVLPALIAAARESVRERRRVEADLAQGLSATAYIVGRWVALCLAGLAPTAVATGALFLGQGGEGLMEAALVSVVGMASATATGLAASCVVRRESRLPWVLGALLLAHVLLCGAFVGVEQTPVQPLAALTPGYWVFRGLAAVTDLAGLDPACPVAGAACSSWSAAAGLGAPLVALLLLGATALAGAILVRRRGPHPPGPEPH